MKMKAEQDRVATIGIDTGKNTLHLIGLNSRGKIVLKQKISRVQASKRFADVVEFRARRFNREGGPKPHKAVAQAPSGPVMAGFKMDAHLPVERSNVEPIINLKTCGYWQIVF